jgi:hypothetical protein
LPGIVNATLDSNGKPVYSGLSGNAHILSAVSFSQWYKDVKDVNHSTASKMALWNDGKGNYVNRYGANGEQWNTTAHANWCGTVADALLDTSGKPIPCTFQVPSRSGRRRDRKSNRLPKDGGAGLYAAAWQLQGR